MARLRAHSWKRVFSDSVEGNKYLPQSSSWWKGEIGICIVKSDLSHPFKGALSLNACAAFYASVWRLTGGLLSRRVGGHLWTQWREKKGNLGLSKWYRTDVLHLTVKVRRHVYWMQVTLCQFRNIKCFNLWAAFVVYTETRSDRRHRVLRHLRSVVSVWTRA